MTRLLDTRRTTKWRASSPLSFETTGDSSWKVWDRFIAVDGQNIYHMGNICGTCAFFFEKLKGQGYSIHPDRTAYALNAGLTSTDNDTVNMIKRIIPKGSYQIALLTIQPKFVVVGQSNDYFVTDQAELWSYEGVVDVPAKPKSDYYRGTDTETGDDGKLFEFFIPLTSPESLDNRRVEFYKHQIREGIKPTAVSLTVLDIKGPADWPGDGIKPLYTAHWCLAHYVIDGHHKIKAASDLNAEITLLSYIAAGKGVSSNDDVAELLKIWAGKMHK